MSDNIVCLESHCVTVDSVRKLASDSPFGHAPAEAGQYLVVNSGTVKQ